MPKAKRVFTPHEKKNQNSPKYKKRKKNFRKAHKDNRNKSRKANYSKTRPTVRKNRPWEEWEMDAIFHQDNWTDFQMSKNLRRSVQAIQQKRSQLKKSHWINTLQKTGKITQMDLGVKMIKPFDIDQIWVEEAEPISEETWIALGFADPDWIKIQIKEKE